MQKALSSRLASRLTSQRHWDARPFQGCGERHDASGDGPQAHDLRMVRGQGALLRGLAHHLLVLLRRRRQAQRPKPCSGALGRCGAVSGSVSFMARGGSVDGVGGRSGSTDGDIVVRSQ
jgi:hypothetical protein